MVSLGTRCECRAWHARMHCSGTANSVTAENGAALVHTGAAMEPVPTNSSGVAADPRIR